MNQEVLEVRNLMLAIAHNAIDSRAELDEYATGEYDAVHDPEGYITSLLNALHQWAHAHGIDWENELTRSQGFFEHDVEGLERETTESVSEPAIAELRCPKCEHEDSFVVEVSECLLMFTDGVVLHGDSGEEWGDWSYCRCHSCDHRGTVYQFRACKQSIKEVDFRSRQSTSPATLTGHRPQPRHLSNWPASTEVPTSPTSSTRSSHPTMSSLCAAGNASTPPSFAFVAAASLPATHSRVQ